MKANQIFIVIFCVLLLFVGTASAATDKVVNGDFEDGLTGWTTNVDNYNTATGYIDAVQNGGVDNSDYVKMTGYSGSGGGYTTISLSQAISSGTIREIWYSYKYVSDYDVVDIIPRFSVYWGGVKIDEVDLIGANSGGDWVQRIIEVNTPITSGSLTFQANLYVDGTDLVSSSAVLALDDIHIISSGNAPIITSIIQSPATSSGDKEPAPASITFSANVVGSEPLTYAWDFTNDGTTDATGSTATYTYAQPGTYTCKLTLSNAEGSTTATTTVYVDNPLPQGDFYASPISGNAPLNVQFILTATGAGETYQWWFGDGNEVGGTPDSTQAQPSYTYREEGTYTVTLIITNSVGSVTLTKTDLISVSPEGSTSTSTGIGSIYAPHSVQMMFLDVWGNPVRDLDVSFEVSDYSGNIDEILKWFGINNPAAITGNQQAATSADGTISWLALPQIQYEVSYIWEGKSYSFLIYPQDTNYVIRVGSGNQATLGEAAADLSWKESEDYEELQLSLRYYQVDTSNVYFWIRADGELIYSQTFAGNRVNMSYLVPNTRGIVYTWGYNASLTDGSTMEDSRQKEALGNPSTPLWDLGFQNYGYGTEWYMYIAFGLTLLVASLFYSTTAKQGGVVVGLILGSLFLFVRWIPLMYAPLIALAGGLALIAAVNKDGREIGFTSVLLLVVLSGAVIGLINSSGLFGAGYAGTVINFDFGLDVFASSTDSSIWTTAYTLLGVVTTMVNMAYSAVHMVVFAAPLLISLGMPVELAAVITAAIWLITTLWFVMDFYPRIKG